MMRREVNFLHEVSRDAIDFVDAGGDIRAYPLLRPYYTALVFSMRHPVLKRREVRVAINEALDRNELVRNAMRGHGRIAEGPFRPYHWAYPQGRFPVAFNPEAAKLRLEASGLKVSTGSAQQMPARFAFTCLVLAGDDRFERIAQLVQRQLYAVGIDMQIEPPQPQGTAAASRSPRATSRRSFSRKPAAGCSAGRIASGTRQGRAGRCFR